MFRFLGLMALVAMLTGGASVVPQAYALSKVQGTVEPSFKQVLQDEGIDISGPGYEILAPIERSGTLFSFQLKTDFGTFPVRGTALLRKRLKELDALRRLERTDWGALAGDGAVEAVKRPLSFLGDLVRSPVDTLSNSAENLGQLVDGTVKTVSGETPVAAGPQREDEATSTKIAAAVVGRDRARREIAVKLGVDPYTTFAPLSAGLDKAAWSFASSNRVVRLATIFIPGGVGTAVTGVMTSASIQEMLVENPTILNERMREALSDLGVSPEATRAFLGQRVLTPAEKLVFVAALQQLGPVPSLDEQVQLVAQAEHTSSAYYMVMAALMAVNYHQEQEPLIEFKLLDGVPYGRTAAGKVAVFIAGDRIGWDLAQRIALIELQGKLERMQPVGEIEYRVYGLAQASLHEALWDRNAFIRERAPLAGSLEFH